MVRSIDPAVRSEKTTDTTGLVSSGTKPATPILSHRELEIAGWLLQGKTNKEIAKQLFLSPETVKTHLGNILRKLRAKNRTEAALKAAEQSQKAFVYQAAEIYPLHEQAAENRPDYLE